MSLLTRSKPNFCCFCGAKIVRLRWHPWTSRRFCRKCVPNFRKEHWLQPILLIVALFGFGLLIGRQLRSPPPPLLIQRAVIQSASVNAGSQNSSAPLIEDDTYVCGARTKKGTPCSRRVHGPVRCWQHKGMPAMVPIEKLRVTEQK